MEVEAVFWMTMKVLDEMEAMTMCDDDNDNVMKVNNNNGDFYHLL